ncbi:DgyrCDS7186 [Dimorphilus gyrociliatus]|uniref:DgyrCDS7186 n=1 Tax=Dimorphilus gyrociliatus TaxID=2664684 RepID=A0A7I8VSY4_9ANNE|nr:DgyrCDS7186 [Dimorphilus gyrociliatus]
MSQAEKDRKNVRLAPIQLREKPSKKYTKPISGRESWWRNHIKETPNPGAYEPFDPWCELSKRPNSYRFKAGKRVTEINSANGALLLPGAYNHPSFTQRLDKENISTYSFKGCGRLAKSGMQSDKKDKYIDVCPGMYNTENYLAVDGHKATKKLSVFKSTSTRLPSDQMKPKIGPAPGYYEYRSPTPPHAISSSFKSTAPRFKTSHTKTPGAGSYEPTYQSPMPETIKSMARIGTFFNSANAHKVSL